MRALFLLCRSVTCMHVRHTFLRESIAMSEQFQTGEGKLFHGLAVPQRNRYTRSTLHHLGQLFEIDEEGMEIGQFSYCFDFPLYFACEKSVHCRNFLV